MSVDKIIPEVAHVSPLLGNDSALPLSHVSGEYFGRRKDGSRVPLEINFSRIQSADGTFFLVSMLDITKRKKAEAALQEANAELLQQANDRVLRIQAEAAQAEAEAANRAKDHFPGDALATSCARRTIFACVERGEPAGRGGVFRV